MTDTQQQPQTPPPIRYRIVHEFNTPFADGISFGFGLGVAALMMGGLIYVVYTAVVR